MVCRAPKKEVHQVQSPDGLGSEEAFLGEIKIHSSDFWSTQIYVNGNKTEFKLDCGAKVSILSSSVPWLKEEDLQPTSQVLKGAGDTDLTHLVIGEIRKAKLQGNHRSTTETIYILKNQSTNLLSKKVIQDLQLLTPSADVHTVQKDWNPKKDFRQLFTGLGRTQDAHHITLQPNATPVCLYTARRIPYAWREKVQEELKSMVARGVISPVDQPTQWCSGMVCVPKSDGRVRICVDLTPLNRSVQREIHPMATVDENLAKLQGSSIFSKLDANSGFWQIPLDEESRLLTTFVTPFGRFCFNRLPFGISSAPEVFQKTMHKILQDVDGCICHMDDVLVHGKDRDQHDGRLRTVLKKIQSAGLTLNPEKCEFFKTKVSFLGHVITSAGVEVDPKKTAAIRDFPRPTCVKDLQRLLGMLNQCGKFIPHLSVLTEPIRQLLKKDQEWIWDAAQEESFLKVKDLLASSEVLSHYEVKRKSIVAADACNIGLGAVLLQEDDGGNRRPICYASRSLTTTEKNYAVIEKEALAVTWACEKFSEYLLGSNFLVETDHRPLVTLLTSKDISKLPPRILRFRLRLMRYSPSVVYVQGKNQVTADALSRGPAEPPTSDEVALLNEVETFQKEVILHLPATERRIKEIADAQDQDPVCQQVKAYCRQSWPAAMPHQPLLKPYYEKRQNITLHDGVLLYNGRLVIPTSLQLEVLDQIHSGHLGMSKCKARAQDSVWWPNITSHIEAMIHRCRTCAAHLNAVREPLMALAFNEDVWDHVGADLFHHQKEDYLIVVDYCSRWFEIRKLSTALSVTVITAMKDIFAAQGIPSTVTSDNGPQFASREFAQFAKEWQFTHVTSSALHPQCNGEAE